MIEVFQIILLNVHNALLPGTWITTSYHIKPRINIRHHQQSKEKIGDLYFVRGNKHTFLVMNIEIK